MNAEEFVRCFRREKDDLLAAYLNPVSGSSVATEIAKIVSSPEQHSAIQRILDGVLTDTLYTVLLALDGSASLGGVQKSYRIQDEDGAEVSVGDGTIEALAYDYFHGNPTG